MLVRVDHDPRRYRIRPRRGGLRARQTMKARRQSVILDVIQREAVRSQEQLRQRVAAAGHDVTQATLSRDIRELGLVKGGADGAYQTPAGGAQRRRTLRCCSAPSAST